MRYFIISEKDRNVALVCHDYKRGAYVYRSTLESFAKIFDATATKLGISYTKGSVDLKAVNFSPFEYDWVDKAIGKLLSVNEKWHVAKEGETSSSDLTIDDLVDKYLK